MAVNISSNTCPFALWICGFYTFTPLKILTENLNISVEILSLFDGKIWYLKALTELKYEVYRNVS
jgi:hypothetical protein